MNLDRLFHLMSEKEASDLYLSVGSPVSIKLSGVCVPINQDRLRPEDVLKLLSERVTAEQLDLLNRERELNIGLTVPPLGSFRLSAFRQRGTVSAVIRYIPQRVPRIDKLMLPSTLKTLALERRGLILLVGAAGSGKSTTVASMIEHRNESMSGHILTFEDPIEFLFQNKQSIINQREIGADALTLQEALRNAMRQAPDVLFIGEIRDLPAMQAAIAYSMSGQLVIATLHATNSAHALNRVISFYPNEARAALFQDLAASLRAVISQRLVRSKKGGRVPAVEILRNEGHTRELVERGDVLAIKDSLDQSLAPESCSFEQSLYGLLQKELVTREDALGCADSKNNLLWLINNAGKSAQPEPPKEAQPKTASYSEFTLDI